MNLLYRIYADNDTNKYSIRLQNRKNLSGIREYIDSIMLDVVKPFVRLFKSSSRCDSFLHLIQYIVVQLHFNYVKQFWERCSCMKYKRVNLFVAILKMPCCLRVSFETLGEDQSRCFLKCIRGFLENPMSQRSKTGNGCSNLKPQLST